MYLILFTNFVCNKCKVNKMYQLNLPHFEIKIAEKNDRTYVFDVLRKKYIALTPEEWVRQHFVHYLLEHKGYPAHLLTNEVELTIGSKKLRCDSLLYGKDTKPRMIIEYKAPYIKITQKVFNQIYAYNLILNADYLIISNGLQHIICKVDYSNKRYVFLKDIPDYNEL